MPELLNLFAPALIDLTTLRGLLAVVIGVGALIFFHELGHFLAAKWAGVRVEVFSLGFGRRLFGFRRGETDYRISLLPLGGYVRMLGQADDDPDQPPTDLPCDFRNQPPGKRFVILVAGVVMNLILAAVGFMGAFGLGVEFSAAEVGRVQPGSAAARADLRAGDLVLSADGSEVLGWQDLQTLVAVSSGELELELLRDGQRVTTRARPFRAPGESYARLGVEARTVVADLTSQSPLRAAGVQTATPTSSDRLLSVCPVDSRCPPDLRMSDQELAQAIDEARGPVVVTWERTRYDDEGRPSGSERLERVVEPIQRPEYALGLELPDHAWVREVVAGSPAEKAGVKTGDRLISLADRQIDASNLREVTLDVGARLGEAPQTLVVERPTDPTAPLGPSQRLELQVALELENPAALELATGARPEGERLALRREVGKWLLGVRWRDDVISAPSRLEPAEPGAAPVVLQPGDQVTRVWLSGGLWWSGEVKEVASPEMQRVLRARGEEPLQIAWIPAGQEAEQRAVVRARLVPGETWGDLGIMVGERPVRIQRGPLQAVGLGLHQTMIQTQRIFLMLRSFITGSVSPRELGGPIMIANVAYTVATKDSFSKLLHLLAILSVNLAVINILPIPVLDGGHIAFLLFEKLKGRPVSGDVMATAQWVGLFLILGLMALVFFNDIRRIALQ